MPAGQIYQQVLTGRSLARPVLSRQDRKALPTSLGLEKDKESSLVPGELLTGLIVVAS